MTDEDSPDTDSRRRRLATRQRRTRNLGAFVAIALIALGTGTAMALRNSDPTPPPPADNGKASDSTPPAPDSSISPVRKLGPPRLISHDDPLRLWIGGDSLAGSFGPALGQTSAATGVVDATIDYKVSSGLADAGIRDWDEHAQQEMDDIDPDAVVFIIGANDVSIVNTYDSDDDGTPDWQVDYRKKIHEMMNILVGGDRHRTVYWLGPPTMGDDDMNKGGYELGRVMWDEAKKFGRDIVYINTYKIFADENGDYARYLPDADGEETEMRISDGVHFSVDGANFLADKLWRRLNARWQISPQADPEHPIDYTIAEGSNDYVPGVGRYRPTVTYGSSDTTPDTGSSDTATTIGSDTTVATQPVASTTQPVATTTKPVVTTPTTPPTKKPPGPPTTH